MEPQMDMAQQSRTYKEILEPQMNTDKHSVGYAHNPIQEKQEIYYDLLVDYS